MIPGAVALTIQVLLTDMQPLASNAFLTPAELPVTVVIIITYLVQGRKDKERCFLCYFIITILHSEVYLSTGMAHIKNPRVSHKVFRICVPFHALRHQ